MSALRDTRLPKCAAVGIDWLPVAAGSLLLCVPTFYQIVLLTAALIALFVLDGILARIVNPRIPA